MSLKRLQACVGEESSVVSQHSWTVLQSYTCSSNGMFGLWKLKTFLEGRRCIAVDWKFDGKCIFVHFHGQKSGLEIFSHRGFLKVGKAIDFEWNDDDLRDMKYHNKAFW